MTGGGVHVADLEAHKVAKIAEAYLALGFRLFLVNPTKRKNPHSAAHRFLRDTPRWGLFAAEYQPGDVAWLTGERVTRRDAPKSGPLTLDEIRRALAKFPEARLAIFTGGWFCVIDVDKPEYFPGTLAIELGETVSARSEQPGRMHFYCRCPEGTPGRKLPFGELKARGAYVLAPPGLGRTWIHAPWDTEMLELPPSITALGHKATPQTPTQRALSGVQVREEREELRALTGGQKSSSRVQGRVGNVDVDEAWVLRALRAMGVEHRNAKRINCPVHKSKSSSSGAVIAHKDSGALIFVCAGCEKGWPLAALYGLARGQRKHIRFQDEAENWVSKTLNEIPGPSLTRWQTRLLAETGLIELPTIDVPTPIGAKSMQDVASGFLLLLAVTLYDRRRGDPVGTVFAAGLGAPWCGVSESTFLRRKGDLIDSGWLLAVGDAGKATLWLPRGFAANARQQEEAGE